MVTLNFSFTLSFVAPLLLGFIIFHLENVKVILLLDNDSKSVCWLNASEGNMICRPSCNDIKSFSLPGMTKCRFLLNCQQIKEEVKIHEVIGYGAVKMVSRGEWDSHQVAVNQLIDPAFAEDFWMGKKMLTMLQPSGFVTELVGICQEENVFITRFYPLGSADRLLSHWPSSLVDMNTLTTRFRLCIQYATIIHYLHTGPFGTHVMCDSNDPNKTLSQFLIKEDLSLVLNDVDALPLVNRTQSQLVKCGHQELFGNFVAPEQLWPFQDREFVDKEMPGYDEKTDVWKIPDICDALIGNIIGGNALRLHLLTVHIKCKLESPSLRPTAKEVLNFYEKELEKMLQNHL